MAPGSGVPVHHVHLRAGLSPDGLARGQAGVRLDGRKQLLCRIEEGGRLVGPRGHDRPAYQGQRKISGK